MTYRVERTVTYWYEVDEDLTRPKWRELVYPGKVRSVIRQELTRILVKDFKLKSRCYDIREIPPQGVQITEEP